MSAERLYGLLLRAYPPEFRAEYEREMVLLFRDLCRERDVRTVGFWAGVIGDVARSAPALRVTGWRENLRALEGIMKRTAILMSLVGVLGFVNVGVEWMAGGTGSTQHMLALVLSIGASVLLFVSGGAILRPTGRGRQAGRLALVGSLVLIVAARLVHPWMGIFAQLVGIGMPIAFLIVLSWPRRPSTSGAI